MNGKSIAIILGTAATLVVAWNAYEIRQYRLQAAEIETQRMATYQEVEECKLAVRKKELSFKYLRSLFEILKSWGALIIGNLLK